MEFKLNQLNIESSFITAIEEESENTTLAQYTAFKKISSALVNEFDKVVTKNGSINSIPCEILTKYNKIFNTLIENYKNLRDDLQRQLNKNNRELEHIQSRNNTNTFIAVIAHRKHESLQLKIQYVDTIRILNIAIESCIDLKPLI